MRWIERMQEQLQLPLALEFFGVRHVESLVADPQSTKAVFRVCSVLSASSQFPPRPQRA